jgi:hypothetical protein
VPRSTPAVLAAVAAMTAAACTSGTVVTTGDTNDRAAPDTSTKPSVPPNNFNLANAYDFFAQSDGQAGYYFTTPSGRWRCAIVPHSKAGCQSASNPRSNIGIPGEPETVPDEADGTDTPNAIEVESAGDAHFGWLGTDEFTLVPGPANTLQFNKILAAAGFRCNVQEAGVSCLSESTGSGFTFSADGFTLQYTDVPASPPS